MAQPAYAVARSVASTVAEHLRRHRAKAGDLGGVAVVDLLPDAHVIESLVDAAFWASVRREEGYVPKISLAFLPPRPEVMPLVFERPFSLDPSGLTRLAAAVERPGIHLGVWSAPATASARHVPNGALEVWGTTHAIPPFCFVVEVIAAGLLVLKHRPREESRKFVNVAVLEGDRIKIVDEGASRIADCPALLASMIGFDTQEAADGSMSILVQLALSMRKHARGGIMLVVPGDTDAWRDSIVQPINYAVSPPYTELGDLVAAGRGNVDRHDWLETVGRAVDAIAGLTAVDGATVMSHRYDVLAFGAKIGRRKGAPQIERLVVTEPVEGSSADWMHPGQLGGTRHLSAAQFVHDQPDAMALVASQDGRFTIFAWSPCDAAVHAHRVETLLL
jgi:hypothetical protein